MKKRTLIGLCVLFLCAVTLVACTEKEEKLHINPEITLYSPSMSSTPGIGLIAAFDRDLKNSDYKFHWETEEGTFLQWKKSGAGKIEQLGSDVYTNEHKVYWTVLLDSPPEGSEFYVHLSVVKLDNQEVVDKTSLKIYQKEKGVFTIESD